MEGVFEQGAEIVEPGGRGREDGDDEIEVRLVPKAVGFAEEDEGNGGMGAGEGDCVLGQSAVVIAKEDGLWGRSRFRAGGESGTELCNRWAMLDLEASSGEDGEPVAGVASEEKDACAHSATQCVWLDDGADDGLEGEREKQGRCFDRSRQDTTLFTAMNGKSTRKLL